MSLGDARSGKLADNVAGFGRALRRAGVKLRDTRSLGLPHHWRLSVQPLEAQAALFNALKTQMEISQ